MEDSRYSILSKSELKRVGNGFCIKRKTFHKNGPDKVKKKVKNSEILTSKQNVNSEKTSREKLGNNLSIQQQRCSLPIYHCKQRFLNEFRKHDTLLVIGETGSGKTTQIPQFIYETELGNVGLIAVTQPRRVATITVAKRVAQEVECTLGGTVGFTVRFEDCTSKLTKIRFMTDGSLLREAINDRLLLKYSVIMLDEAHERTINTDILFGIVKNAQKERTLRGMCHLKIIVTSATMDIDKIGSYFGVRGIYVEGRTFPVRIMHTKESQSDYLHACLVTFFEIHRNAPPNHDILVFLTGQDEIESLAQKIRFISKTNELNAPNLRVFPLYSQMSQSKQLECFLPSPPNSRKVILATNIAETSITIPGIRYVIDCGYVKQRIFDPCSGLECLKVVRISQAQSWQRCGRAGRESEGFCYRVYTKEEMDSFEKMPKPEILRSNITSVILQLLALDIDCRNFDFLDKPSSDAIAKGYRQLHLLGAIKSPSSTLLTSMGKKMVLFPLDPRFSKLLLAAPKFGCLEEMISLVAVLSGESLFLHSTEKREQVALAHAKFGSEYGDHLTLLNVFKAFQTTDKIKHWCHDHFLNTRNLLYAQDIRNQLKQICSFCEMPFSSCGNDVDQVRKCLLAGLFNNIAELQRDNFYMTLSDYQKAKIHPSSVLSGKSKPSHLLYTEIVSTEKTYLRLVTSIEPEWIEEIVPNYPYIHRIQKLSRSHECYSYPRN